MKEVRFIVTCEHGGNRIPQAYARYFAGRDALLESHEGHDAGALVMGKEFAKALEAPYVSATVSRLLVDLNRSLGQPDLHAGFIAVLPDDVRAHIVDRYYRPYRDRAEDWIMASICAEHRVVHISSHSFTPVLKGQERNADLGLLFDPRRKGEAQLCKAWQAALKRKAPELRVRLNYPYKGASDGFATYLRQHFDGDHYLGIEVELNQALVGDTDSAWAVLRKKIVASLKVAVANCD